MKEGNGGEMFTYICLECGKIHKAEISLFRCDCGGLFNIHGYDRKTLEGKINEITMGEKNTPIVGLPGYDNLMLKLEYMMPTLSFKDRGAATLIALASLLGADSVLQDSSGNAGAAIAAYASRAGMKAKIFISDDTPGRKKAQIAAYGASLISIAGSREDVAKAALLEAEKAEAFYASHVYNPFFHLGVSGYVKEIFYSLGKLPDVMYIPVGNGTMLLGTLHGLLELKEKGLISKYPKVIAVQSEAVSPLYDAYINETEIKPMPGKTLAKGIAIADPKRGKQIIESMRELGGEFVIAREENLERARDILARGGFHVEHTTAATFAAYLDRKHGREKVLLPLCGSGLKE